jgi:alpha-1,3-rhamnosyltransferase
MSEPQAVIHPDVFVVVPSYNHAPFVEKCLRSIIGQTLRPKKLLVIDDGSTDGSPAVIENVLNDCPFASELIARENRGLCATLNQAHALSSGEYFGYLGSDDLWLPEFLEKQTKLLTERTKAVLAFSHAYLIDENDNITGSTADWTDFADGDLLPLLMQGVVFSSPGVLYRRSALENQEWNEASRLEDYEMYLRLSVDGEFARNPKVLCAWRQHGDNASSRLPTMFGEMMVAQSAVASDLGIVPEELARIQRRAKFDAAENFVRHGFRHEASRLFVENITGASSPWHIAKTAFRLLVPQALFQWNRRRKRRIAVERFGGLDDIISERKSDH